MTTGEVDRVSEGLLWNTDMRRQNERKDQVKEITYEGLEYAQENVGGRGVKIEESERVKRGKGTIQNSH